MAVGIIDVLETINIDEEHGELVVAFPRSPYLAHLRLEESGKVYVLEANPNPQLAYGEDFAESAERAGMDYPALLQRIVNLGMRWRPDRGG